MSDLEQLALDGHAKGETWEKFFASHGDAMREKVPWDRKRYHRLYRKLMHLLLCGDNDGQHAVGDDDAMPWEVDDAADMPSDATTNARLQLNLPFGSEAVTP